ncbi:UNVERIFIED_CONTAM: hypothetical protein FKN15_018720 [Acipenser sinensis]
MTAKLNTFVICLLVRFVNALPCCKLRAALVEGFTRSGRYLGCSTPLQALRCTGCVTALQLSADYAPHRCKLHAVPGCVTVSSPDTDTQPSTLVLCPWYLVLGTSAPPCLGLDTHGTLGSLVPQSLDSLSASASSAPRELHASVLRRIEAF